MARTRACGEGGWTVPGPDWGREQPESARARAAKGEQPDSAKARLDLTDAGDNSQKTVRRLPKKLISFRHKNCRENCKKLQENS